MMEPTPAEGLEGPSSPFLNLPVELQAKLVTYCDRPSLFTLRRTCKAIREVVDSMPSLCYDFPLVIDACDPTGYTRIVDAASNLPLTDFCIRRLHDPRKCAEGNNTPLLRFIKTFAPKMKSLCLNMTNCCVDELLHLKILTRKLPPSLDFSFVLDDIYEYESESETHDSNTGFGAFIRFFCMDMPDLEIFEKVTKLELSEILVYVHRNWVQSKLLPYLSTSKALRILQVPIPITYGKDFVNSVKEFLEKSDSGVQVVFEDSERMKTEDDEESVEDWESDEDGESVEDEDGEYVEAVKKLLTVAGTARVRVDLMLMMRYLEFMREEWREEATAIVKTLKEIENGSFPLLKNVGELLLKAANLETISIRDHEKVPEDFDYGEVFPQFAEWLPKNLKRVWVSLPMCQKSLISLKWPASVVDVGVRISPHENHLEKVVANIGAHCPFLERLDVCLKYVDNPNKVFINLPAENFNALRNLQIKTSVFAEFPMSDSSLVALAKLPLIELFLCFEAPNIPIDFKPGRKGFKVIPSSKITVKGLDAVSKMEKLLCFSVKIQGGLRVRRKLEARLKAEIERLEALLEERRSMETSSRLMEADTFTAIASVAFRNDPTWFLTKPVVLHQ